jgi:hypothetical protein
MALIDPTVLIGIADRAAQQYNILRQGFENANFEGGGFYFDRVTLTNDADVEIPSGLNFEALDNDFDVDRAINRGTQLPSVIGVMENHFNITNEGLPLQVGGWNGYLYSHDLRVSWWFNKLFRAIKNTWLMAVNVFSESEDVFGMVEVDSENELVFTDGLNYGNGSDFNFANGENFAATQLKVVIDEIGLLDLDLRLSVKDINDNPTTIDITIPGGSLIGSEFLIGTNLDRFLDVFSVSFIPFGNKGTVGDMITIKNKKERQVAL